MSRKPYVREFPRTTWYLKKNRDRLHMAQEITSIFIAIYAFILLLGLGALATGPQAWQGFLEALGSPLSLLFHWIVFVVALFHSISWFNVTHKAMPIQRGEDFLPGGVIVASHYVVWILFSLIVIIIGGAFSG